MDKKPIIVFASGSKDGGGSGFENLAKATSGILANAQIVAVVSSHEYGGVRERADRLGIPFEYLTAPYTAERYREIVAKYNAEFVALSGWLKLVAGLNPKTTFNIHPGPLPAFGGKGMYGHHVHEAVLDAFKRGEITHSAVTMHFVTEEYDRGPIFFVGRVPIHKTDTAEELGARVNRAEHKWQPLLTEMVVTGAIRWDGHDSTSLFPIEPIKLTYRDE